MLGKGSSFNCLLRLTPNNGFCLLLSASSIVTPLQHTILNHHVISSASLFFIKFGSFARKKIEVCQNARALILHSIMFHIFLIKKKVNHRRHKQVHFVKGHSSVYHISSYIIIVVVVIYIIKSELSMKKANVCAVDQRSNNRNLLHPVLYFEY